MNRLTSTFCVMIAFGLTPVAQNTRRRHRRKGHHRV